ncbi:Factor arrest protein 11 [Rhodotorula toruloides]|nr:Factor arrest protein 11 [Rhodotorula toruloides]
MVHQPTPASPSASSLRPLASPSSPPTASLTSLRELDRQQAVDQERERFNTPLPRRRRPGIARELSDPGATSSVGDSMFQGQGNGAAGQGQQSYASMVSAGLDRPQLGNGAGAGAGAGPAGGGPGGVASPTSLPRPKQLVYTFPSPPPDTADLLSELEEFYSYVEIPQVLEHMESWNTSDEGWKGEQGKLTKFTKSPPAAQQAYISNLLTTLLSSSSSHAIRHTAARHLLHIAHGTFSPTTSTSPEHHLHLVLTNCRVLREAGALVKVWEALKRTGREWENISSLVLGSGVGGAGASSGRADDGTSDEDEAEGPVGPGEGEESDSHALHRVQLRPIPRPRPPKIHLSPPARTQEERESDEQREKERQDRLDEINAELAILLAVLYFMVECARGDDKWGEELMALDPPMPVYLYNQVAGLREKNAKGYPVKKASPASPYDLSKLPTDKRPIQLLLLLWKSMLCTLGGLKDVARVKALVREVEGLPKDEPGDRPDYRPWTKATPPDLLAFRNETLAKYPSYTPPPAGSLLPLPPPLQALSNNPTTLDRLSAAAAPVPRGRAVPRAVEEAGELYRRNLRVSTELWQAWKVREEFRGEEMGLTRAEQVEREAVVKEEERRRKAAKEQENKETKEGREMRRKAMALGRRLEELATGSAGSKSRTKAHSTLSDGSGGIDSPITDDVAVASDDEDEDEDPMDPLTVLRNLARSIKKEIEVEPDEKKRKELEERRMDVKRLERVEILYRQTLPHLQSAVIVLLKLLLATVTANQNLSNPNQNAPEPTSSDPPPDLSLEDIDILRHREITSKAVSAILILTLKWFKASHVMKFHYFSQLLVDSNCLLLILKMFGMQEVSTLVRIKHEKPDYNFFKFCNDHINPSSASPRPEDAMLSLPPPGNRPRSPSSSSPTDSAPIGAASAHGVEGEDVEIISDYSWRNFFSTINFVHILQKLTKRKTHRVLLMVQYKSSAILKRILKVAHPTLQLYVLKVIKSQVPYCGRKWRQSSMKVITAIYLHCRPDLRDEWLAGIDVDADVEESLPHEQALRSLVRFFNTKHYSKHAPGLHRRSSSIPENANDPSPDFNPGPVASVPLPPLSPHGPPPDPSALDDVFPPPRALSSIDVDATVPLQLAYGAIDPNDDLSGYEVDDLLAAGADPSHGSRATDDASGSSAYTPSGSVGLPRTSTPIAPNSQPNSGQAIQVDHDDLLDWLNDPLGASDAAWERLGLEGYDGEWDDVSDSESVGGWGFMRFGLDEPGATGTLADDGGEVLNEQAMRHEWEHISPETISALEEERAASRVPNSPRPSRRRSSTGPISPALRPVIFDRDDDGTCGPSDNSAMQEGDEEGPVPTVPHEGPAIDEVELIFNR